MSFASLPITVVIQTMNKEKAAIHLWPITFMKGWMHNLSAHQHESRCEDAKNGRSNNSPIAAPFAGGCQAVTPQAQLIRLPPTLGTSLLMFTHSSLLMWKYDGDALLSGFANPPVVMRGRNNSGGLFHLNLKS